MSSLPAIFAEGCAACAFSVGFGSTGPAGDPSLPLLDVEQFWTCVHVKEAALESGKLNQSLWTPPPLCQPIENHSCVIRIISGSSQGLLHLIETTHVEWQDMKDRINLLTKYMQITTLHDALTKTWLCYFEWSLRQRGSVLQVDLAEDFPWSMGQAGEHPLCSKSRRHTLNPAGHLHYIMLVN